ncbi:hypothetical protein BT63DRAFT_102213 [Microthyrium microscopicum]|uniref:Uncharacterized protein n=1 Tax=Microthyrium microscopicum TaxID=703497 RepID=A0A6A6TXH0_9PEZI|nr:hypothetical protein BT63DRAFT_102213 [Microthyrium microscopicum]
MATCDTPGHCQLGDACTWDFDCSGNWTCLDAKCSDTKQNNFKSPGYIAGGAVGVVVILILICVGVWLCIRTRRRRRLQHDEELIQKTIQQEQFKALSSRPGTSHHQDLDYPAVNYGSSPAPTYASGYHNNVSPISPDTAYSIPMSELMGSPAIPGSKHDTTVEIVELEGDSMISTPRARSDSQNNGSAGLGSPESSPKERGKK